MPSEFPEEGHLRGCFRWFLQKGLSWLQPPSLGFFGFALRVLRNGWPAVAPVLALGAGAFPLLPRFWLTFREVRG